MTATRRARRSTNRSDERRAAIRLRFAKSGRAEDGQRRSELDFGFIASALGRMGDTSRGGQGSWSSSGKCYPPGIAPGPHLPFGLRRSNRVRRRSRIPASRSARRLRLAADLNGTFNVTRVAIPHLKKSKAGAMINMSSVAGRFGYANRSPYCTAKWGIIGFTKTLSIELGEHGIRANAILPGAVDRPRIQKVFEGRATSSGKSVEEIKTEAMAVQSLKTFVDLGISRPLPYSSPRMQPSRFQARCWRLTMTCSRHPDGDKEKQSTQVKNYEQPINILLRDDLAA